VVQLHYRMSRPVMFAGRDILTEAIEHFSTSFVGELPRHTDPLQ